MPNKPDTTIQEANPGDVLERASMHPPPAAPKKKDDTPPPKVTLTYVGPENELRRGFEAPEPYAPGKQYTMPECDALGLCERYPLWFESADPRASVVIKACRDAQKPKPKE